MNSICSCIANYSSENENTSRHILVDIHTKLDKIKSDESKPRKTYPKGSCWRFVVLAT